MAYGTRNDRDLFNSLLEVEINLDDLSIMVLSTNFHNEQASNPVAQLS
jgi:hypothetical protein